jgi:uncharacterized protein (TIGR02145 family)
VFKQGVILRSKYCGKFNLKLYHMKRKFRISRVIIFLLLIQSCKEKPTLPVIITTEVNDISYTSASISGEVSNEGGDPVISRGVCWNTSADPTISNSKTTESGGLGTFTSNITSLTPNTTYYVRAYGTNTAGTGYGESVTFTTLQVAVPVLTTTAITTITQTSAVSGGNITDDKGSAVTARGVCWGTETNPTTANSKTTDGTGTGVFTSSITGLTVGTTYYVRSYATNNIGTAYGNQDSFTPREIVTDIEGNVYHIVPIGTQTWMAENLKTTIYNDGTSIPKLPIGSGFTFTTAAYTDYNYTPANSATYGRLYNWYAVNATDNGGKNVCPISWHVPSDSEWTTLTTYLGGESVAGGKLKETGTTHWASPNTGATNETGFTAIPGGFRDFDGTYYYVGSLGFWWSSTENSAASAWYRRVGYSGTSVYSVYYGKSAGCSVRCLKD